MAGDETSGQRRLTRRDLIAGATGAAVGSSVTVLAGGILDGSDGSRGRDAGDGNLPSGPSASADTPVASPSGHESTTASGQKVREETGFVNFRGHHATIITTLGKHPDGTLLIAVPAKHIPGFLPRFFGTLEDPSGQLPMNEKMANPHTGEALGPDTDLSVLAPFTGHINVADINGASGGKFQWLGVVMLPTTIGRITPKDLDAGQFSTGLIVLSASPFSSLEDLDGTHPYDGSALSVATWTAGFEKPSTDVNPDTLDSARTVVKDLGLTSSVGDANIR